MASLRDKVRCSAALRSAHALSFNVTSPSSRLRVDTDIARDSADIKKKPAASGFSCDFPLVDGSLDRHVFAQLQGPGIAAERPRFENWIPGFHAAILPFQAVI